MDISVTALDQAGIFAQAPIQSDDDAGDGDVLPLPGSPPDGLSFGSDVTSNAPISEARTQNSSASDAFVGAVDQGFSAVAGFLRREFSYFEQRFAGALQSLFSGSAATAQINASAPLAGGTAAPNSSFAGLIAQAAAKNQVDPSLLTAVIRQESGFRPDARSQAGALGLMQLMPDTARQLGVSNPLDPAQNVDGGARLLRSLLDRYGGRLDVALAAYNAGPGAVDRYGGVPPYPETQAYVRDVMAGYRATALGRAS